ncbi:abscission/NoCut checkpoint regulator isoform X2 [Anabrus simplex]|uniref:abscission/NoCut checkpoint regulator isoform X2 n=1 Tax=Anabrus simplex TaxID=316456 RepID=UPI0035A3D53D
MSCHGCATKFGIFVKDHGCPGCGFAFCSKCLRYKRVIPKLGPDIKTVCRFCYIGVPDASKKAEVLEPPAAYLKRLEALENPAKPPIVVYKTDTKMEQLKSGLAEEDRDIVHRLEKLREDRKKKRIPTEEEIRSRLAALKEASADVEGAMDAKRAASARFVADTRSDQKKTDDLLKQLMEEYVLEERNDSTDAEIAKRLAKLRADDVRARKETEKDKAAGENKDSDEDSSGIRTPSDELEDPPSDPETNMLLQRLMKEAAEKVAKKKARKRAKEGDDSEESDDSDFTGDSSSTDSSHPRDSRKRFINPYTLEKEREPDPTMCFICQEIPTVKCIDCDRLYCDDDNIYFHKIPPYADHKIEAHQADKESFPKKDTAE